MKNETHKCNISNQLSEENQEEDHQSGHFAVSIDERVSVCMHMCVCK
jgi:hypothetical protein